MLLNIFVVKRLQVPEVDALSQVSIHKRVLCPRGISKLVQYANIVSWNAFGDTLERFAALENVDILLAFNEGTWSTYIDTFLAFFRSGLSRLSESSQRYTLQIRTLLRRSRV